MSKHNNSHSELSSLAEDARALMTATADVAGIKVQEARKRLTDGLERAKEFASNVRDQAVAGAKATDEAIHEHPYKAIAIAVGVGALIGYLIGRKGASDKD